VAWTIAVKERARKALANLDPGTARRIVKFMTERLAELEDPRSIGEALSGELAGSWKYRVGDYRLIADLEDATRTIHIVGIGHRREVYRKR
jgi:mRNA interferase RelE/StbE